MRIDAVILGVILVVFLWVMHRRARRNIRDGRRAMYDDCMPMFTDIAITQDEVNYPIMRARYQGYDVTIEPLVDNIAVRKIPVLWLMVSIKAPVPYGGILDYLVRPHNTEYYSPSAGLQTRLDMPPDWPQQHAVLRTNKADDIPPVEVVGRCVTRVFEDPKHKELLITPKGVRIVYMLDEALRSHYLVLRQLIFEHDHIDPELIKHLLDTLVELHNDISQTAKQTQEEKVS